jgi:arylformamidase
MKGPSYNELLMELNKKWTIHNQVENQIKKVFQVDHKTTPMKGRVFIDEIPFDVDFSQFYSICIPVSGEDKQVQAFHIPNAKVEPIRVSSFVGMIYLLSCKLALGDTREGGSVNCQVMTFCPHGNGTHTECVGHITKKRIYVHEILKVKLECGLLLNIFSATTKSHSCCCSYSDSRSSWEIR